MSPTKVDQLLAALTVGSKWNVTREGGYDNIQEERTVAYLEDALVYWNNDKGRICSSLPVEDEIETATPELLVWIFIGVTLTCRRIDQQKHLF